MNEAVPRWRAILQKLPQSHLKSQGSCSQGGVSLVTPHCQATWVGEADSAGPPLPPHPAGAGTGESDGTVISGCWRSCVCCWGWAVESVSCSILTREVHYSRRRNCFLSCLASTFWQNLAECQVAKAHLPGLSPLQWSRQWRVDLELKGNKLIAGINTYSGPGPC